MTNQKKLNKVDIHLYIVINKQQVRNQKKELP